MSCQRCYGLPIAEREERQRKLACPDLGIRRSRERFRCEADHALPGEPSLHDFDRCPGWYIHRVRADGWRPLVGVARMYRSMIDAGSVHADELPAALAEAVALIGLEDNACAAERREEEKRRARAESQSGSRVIVVGG